MDKVKIQIGPTLFKWVDADSPEGREHAHRTRVAARPPAPSAGPGTELQKLTAELGYAAGPTCGCHEYARQMDGWGVDGCRSRRAEIVARLNGARKGSSWASLLAAAPKFLALGLNPLDPAGSLLDEALRRAEAAWPRRLDETNLHPGRPGKRFNTSLLEYGDGYLLAYRTGWAGSEIVLARLDTDFRPRGEPVPLDLRHPAASYGREDPRLFWYAGSVHVAYVGVEGRGGRVHRTNQLYARLGQNLAVQRVYAPEVPVRKPWEKNWAFFEHSGELYAVYTVSPHRVVRVRGDAADWAHEERWETGWAVGEPRGGASPYRLGDEFWHFCHDRIDGPDGKPLYRTGLYAFAAEPPFRPTRVLADPLLAADPATRPADQYASVVFTCGAVRDGDHWVLSSGEHDRWTRLDRLSHAGLETKLGAVP